MIVHVNQQIRLQLPHVIVENGQLAVVDRLHRRRSKRIYIQRVHQQMIRF